jgi:hypothetical protein
MRWPTLLLFLWLAAAFATQSTAAEGRIIKVLPHFLDRQGRHALSPSLYDRDAYQAVLRKNPAQRFGLQFDIQWKAKFAGTNSLKLRIELRGTRPGEVQSLEHAVHNKSAFSQWSALTVQDEAYEQLGEVVAWRATLWEGERMLAEQKSFLW